MLPYLSARTEELVVKHCLAITVQYCFKDNLCKQSKTTGNQSRFYLPDKQVYQAMNRWACIHTPDTVEHHHLRNQVILLDSHADIYRGRKEKKKNLFIYALKDFQHLRKIQGVNLIPSYMFQPYCT